ncbi:diguanylate cyclase [Maridesulfovibrio sp.]|uniref:sensor domain-containing diguanylate cyclase n=1 Tax=Maridesulfovibrio sp. TaxID=2795000 RepID=UPI0029CA9469|nr:diguanylate cyclase [Maridesulfovibrio sp.]
MNQFSELIQENEKWLMERIISYAKLHNFTKYTSTLLDAWRLSISGLSSALCLASQTNGIEEPQFDPDEDYKSDPMTHFGRLEAQRHRERGISISMFLGLLKYYRDAYVDLILEKGSEQYTEPWIRFTIHSFDRIEISLCLEWVSTENPEHITEIEKANRRLSNEKNKYLTIFESTPRPVFIVDKDGLLDTINLAASKLLGLSNTAGKMYYSGGHSTLDRKAEGLCTPIVDYLPWLENEINNFSNTDSRSHRIELDTHHFGDHRYFNVFFARMQDVSDKYSGIIIILDDITKRKMLEDQLNYLATTDALTGAHNRHRFLERGKEEVTRSERYKRPISLLMLDIDYFKNINDTFGHAVGDDVLRALSAKCQSMLRQTDIFGRIGGEEFAAVLPETTLDEAKQVAEKIRVALSQIKVNSSEGQVSFTVSIGVVERKDKQELSNILYYADIAMYEAKNMGRNRVVSKRPE